MKLTSRKAILGNSKRQSRQALVYVSGSRKEVEIRKWFIFLMRGFCRFLCLMCIVKLTHVEYATVWHQSNFRPIIFTGRHEVVAKVIFLHLSLIHSVHGGGLPQCMLGYHPPPGADPLPREQTPLLEQTPPWEQPPQTRHPPGKQTPAYGLRAAGMHPTGMHSCTLFFFNCMHTACSLF